MVDLAIQRLEEKKQSSKRVFLFFAVLYAVPLVVSLYNGPGKNFYEMLFYGAVFLSFANSLAEYRSARTAIDVLEALRTEKNVNENGKSQKDSK